MPRPPTPPTIVWFRHDLRITDHPALDAAHRRGQPVIPVFIWAPDEEGEWRPGGASRWWLHHSLAALDRELQAIGSRLILRPGPSLKALEGLIDETRANAVVWNRRYEPAAIQRDQTIKQALGARGIEVSSHNASLLHEPWTIQNQSGRPFQVFTPFWRHCLREADPAEPLAAPEPLLPPQPWPTSLPLDAFALRPVPDWAGGLRATWQPGSAGAQRHLTRFLDSGFAAYDLQRNLPSLAGTSRLSPHLHFGEISPRQVWHSVRRYAQNQPKLNSGWRHSQFLTEIGWREFAYHLLFHFPHTPTQPLRAEFAQFPWRNEPAWLEAWQHGRTGYPLVDAGMRELWATGWMHNRVRMIVASFLVKDLLLDWREGARWFWDTLVDADLASNTLGWQWSAGCGADAAPYFRVFNPISQGEKFDPEGTYIRRWIPELAAHPSECLQEPCKSPAAVRAKAKKSVGRDYPEPIVNHTIAREVALDAYHRLRRTSNKS